MCKHGTAGCRPVYASVRPPVRPSVTLVNYIQTSKDIMKLFVGPVAASSWLFYVHYEILRETPRRRCLVHGGRKNSQWLASMSLYFGNGKKDHCYYGTLIGSRVFCFVRCHFRRLWETLKGHFSTHKALQSNYFEKCCIYRSFNHRSWLDDMFESTVCTFYCHIPP